MLRLIAILSMTVDHAAFLLVGYGVMGTLPAGSESYMMWDAIYTGLRTVGRMAFPIFAVLLVLGYERTRNFRNYALRLFLLALISEIPFDWVITGHWEMDPVYQNTVYTFLIALLSIRGAEAANLYFRKRQVQKGIEVHSGGLPAATYFWVWLLAAAAGCLVAQLADTDYGWVGVLLILLLYLCRGSKLQQCLIGLLWCVLVIEDRGYPYVLGYVAAFVLIYFLRDMPSPFVAAGKKLHTAQRWATYLYYPAHLLVLWGIYCTVFMY